MYEAERLLLTDTPFVPVYTYVTKRMVSPRLKGWQSNVMDHHYSKDMYFLKALSEAQAEAELQAQEAPVTDDVKADIDSDEAESSITTEEIDGTVTVEETQSGAQDGETESQPDEETTAGNPVG